MSLPQHSSTCPLTLFISHRSFREEVAYLLPSREEDWFEPNHLMNFYFIFFKVKLASELYSKYEDHSLP